MGRFVYWLLLTARNGLLFSLFLWPGWAAAETAPLAAGESLTGAYLRLLAALVLVIGIMLILYALVKKRFSLLHNPGGSRIRLIETRPVAPRKSLCIAEVDGKEFLLGLSQEGISLLAALDQPSAQPNDQPKRQSFDSILKISQGARQTVSRTAEQP